MTLADEAIWRAMTSSPISYQAGEDLFYFWMFIILGLLILHFYPDKYKS